MSGTFGLQTSDFVFNFEPSVFTNPQLSKESYIVGGFVETGYNTFSSITHVNPIDLFDSLNIASNVQQTYYNHTALTMINTNAFGVALNIIAIGTLDYNNQIAQIDTQLSTHRLGRYTISGYNGGDNGQAANLTWDLDNTIIGEVLNDDPTFTIQPITINSASVVFENCDNFGVTTTGTNVICNGGSDGTVTATANGGQTPYTYAWSNGKTTATITGLVASTYTVTATDAIGLYSDF